MRWFSIEASLEDICEDICDDNMVHDTRRLNKLHSAQELRAILQTVGRRVRSKMVYSSSTYPSHDSSMTEIENYDRLRTTDSKDGN